MNKERPQTGVVLLPSQRMHNQELRASDMQATQHPHTFELLDPPLMSRKFVVILSTKNLDMNALLHIAAAKKR